MTSAPRFETARARWSVAVGFVACWVVGLLVGGPDIGPHAVPADICRAFSDGTRVLVFSALVHGVAGVLLVLLGIALGSGPTRRSVVVVASLAAVLSIDQLAGEIGLVLDPRRPGSVALWEMVSRVDGAKMLVLAALVAATWWGSPRRGPGLSIVSGLAVMTLVLSGVGYLTLSAGLMAVAAGSLPLLLVWSLTATRASISEQRLSIEQSRLAADAAAA